MRAKLIKNKKNKYESPNIEEKVISLEMFYNTFVNQKNYLGGDWSVLLAQKPSGATGSCFISKMKVLMKEGVYKEISEIKEGDEVLSFNIFTNKIFVSKVKELRKSIFKRKVEGVILNNKLISTTGHPIVVKDCLIASIEKLKLGMEIFSYSKGWIKVESIKFIHIEEPVYNIVLDNEWQTFFIEDYLVLSGHLFF